MSVYDAVVKVLEDFTFNVDLAATILNAAGISALAAMQGRDMSPLYLAAELPNWRSEFFYEHGTIRNINFNTTIINRSMPEFSSAILFSL